MARVLVVDDSGIVRRNMRMMLKSAGHEVVAEVDNGRSAYLEYKLKLPDLVTMDLTMPEVDGIEAMGMILSEFPAAKIIVVSGSNHKEIIIKAIKAGACHFVIKPIDQEKLASVVAMVLTDDDYNKRLELMERLNAMDSKEPEEKKLPYIIEDKAGKYVVIQLNDTLDDVNVELLKTQVDELLFTFHLKFIFDFGTGIMPLAMLPNIIEIMKVIKQEDGMVRATSSNVQFVQQIKENKNAVLSGLADAIRFLPNS